ncbi:MAG: hypothetical protein IJ856_00515, partial [Candidatus Methanomethylophilaceae archaeon]|nr:hypothetical protein [Candidatus Methanomethylophilaceae archaeon]
MAETPVFTNPDQAKIYRRIGSKGLGSDGLEKVLKGLRSSSGKVHPALVRLILEKAAESGREGTDEIAKILSLARHTYGTPESVASYIRLG